MLAKEKDNETLVTESVLSQHLWLRVISHHLCFLCTDDIMLEANGKMSKTHKMCVSLFYVKAGGFSRVTAALQHNLRV